MDISWDDAKLFLAIAESGSVSAAARRLKLGQPTVTRRLAALEYLVGASLFERSVEGTALTAAGERLVLPARKMAEWAGELQRAAGASDGKPRGLVRVTSSPFACFDFFAPFAGHVAAKNPGLRLEVTSGVQVVDLVRGEADLALRNRAPTGADLVLIDSITLKNAVFVTKELKARLPRKPKPKDLPWIAWSPPYEAVTPNPELAMLIPDFQPAFTADSFLVQYAAAEAGVGAMALTRFRHRFARPTNLVPIDVDLGPHSTLTVYLVAAKSALDVPRIRRVAEMLTDELAHARKSR